MTMSSTKSGFVLILFFTILTREVTSVVAGNCLHAKAELAGLCFLQASRGLQLLAALTLEARCYPTCHSSAFANPVPRMTLHCVLQHETTERSKPTYFGICPKAQPWSLPVWSGATWASQQADACVIIGRVRVKAQISQVYTMGLAVVTGH